LVLFALFVGSFAQNDDMPSLLGKIDVKHAAVASLSDSLFGSKTSLVLTTFAPTGDDNVFLVRDMCSSLDTSVSDLQLETLDNKASWPNQGDALPNGTFGPNPTIISCGGFFVPPGFKSTGSVNLLEVHEPNTPASKTKISTDKKSNFYHHAAVLDVDGDGAKDILAARAYKPLLFGSAQGELVMIKRNNASSWTETVLAEGPDVAFMVADFDGDGSSQVVSAQFFTAQQLSVWWCEGSKYLNCAGSMKSTVIDNTGVPYFNVQWVDLNGDGKKEILATTNDGKGKGAVYAFEQPKGTGAWKDGSKWKKHTLATGYKPKSSLLPGQGSPGTAVAFETKSGGVEILVSADDGGFIDLLKPTSEPFVYEKFHVYNSTGTIGTLAIADCPNGKKVIAAPLFAESKLGVFFILIFL